MGDLVLTYAEAVAAGPASVGGKGWNLGRLHRYGFPVPAGAVLVAEAYRQVMAAPALHVLRGNLANVGAEGVGDPQTVGALAALREEIERAALPPPVRDAVRAFLLETGLADMPIAVRSSATAEDGTAASFAGVHGSLLGVLGVDAALRAISACYASLWTPRAVAYRRRLEIPDKAVACAIALCQMVGGPDGSPPPAAGVAFSCDPRGGRRDRIVIDSAPGLGESVAAGRVNPEEITVALQGRRLPVSRRAGGTGQTLTDAQAAELARLVLRIQWALGDGQDPPRTLRLVPTWRVRPSIRRAGNACRPILPFAKPSPHSWKTSVIAACTRPRWRTRAGPTFLLGQVRLLLVEGQMQAQRSVARATLENAEAEVRRLPFWVRPYVRWLATKARASAARREAGKSALAALYEPIRYLALELGRRMVAHGVLERQADVFHLTWADLQAFLCGEWNGAGARALVADRKAQRDAWLAEKAQDYYILDAEGRPAALPQALPTATPATNPMPEHLRTMRGTHLVGVGAAAGRAAGPARIIRHPEDGHRLERGEILIAPSTDPGWTPLFLRAAGVIMEVGGYLSHGAIVAREYGIPAVVNVPGLLDAVRDGQWLTVDGDSGWVVLSPLPSSEAEGSGDGGRSPLFPSPPEGERVRVRDHDAGECIRG